MLKGPKYPCMHVSSCMGLSACAAASMHAMHGGLHELHAQQPPCMLAQLLQITNDAQYYYKTQIK